MQITIKPTRTWIIGADFILAIIVVVNLCQRRFYLNMSLGIILGVAAGVILTILMKIKKIGKAVQVAVSYYWATLIFKYLGVLKGVQGSKEYYIVLAVITIIISAIHFMQIDEIQI